MKEIKINVNMKVKNMYEFLMRHAYVSLVGVASLAFSIVSFIYLCVNFSNLKSSQVVVLIITSLLFTVINPIWIYVNAGKQVKLNPTYNAELTYEISENGVKVVQNEQELMVEWNEVQKIIETKNNVISLFDRTKIGL